MAKFSNAALRTVRKSKFGNRPTGGYASGKEHGRAMILRRLLAQGVISGLREQVSFTLIPAQYAVEETPGGRQKRRCLERACRYIADFVYTDAAGNVVVEDTKGVRTKDYVIKRKLMLLVHGIRIVEI